MRTCGERKGRAAPSTCSRSAWPYSPPSKWSTSCCHFRRRRQSASSPSYSPKFIAREWITRRHTARRSRRRTSSRLMVVASSSCRSSKGCPRPRSRAGSRSDVERAVFLDRDGTLIRDRGYLADPDGVELLPGVMTALAALRDRRLRLVVVSNQSGIARGMITRVQHLSVDARFRELVLAGGVALDGVYYCEHGPDDGCACRKPNDGMLRAASRDLGIDL